jgi:hypothetical protein
MLGRLLPLLLLAPVLALTAASPAQADPVPAQGARWPMCHQGTDTDGRYCVVSISRSGAGPVRPAYQTPGTYADPFANLAGPGDVHLGLDTVVVHDDLTFDPSPGVPSGDSWTYTLNTGSIRPAELSAIAQHAAMTIGGTATSGYTVSVTVTPTPIAWLAPPTPCSYDGGCGDDTTMTDYTLARYADGVVTDDSGRGLTPSEISTRRGFVRATNAQDSYALYVADSNNIKNTLEIRMANPHYAAQGVLAKGTFETFLPNAYVTRVLRVPDPSALTAATLSVVKYGTTAAPAVAVSHTRLGVLLRISDITFPPRARYLIHPVSTAPGSPRWGSVSRTSRHSVRVAFRTPLADGGTAVTSYRTRCHSATSAWHTAKGSSSPITVGSLPRRGVSCKVQARNPIGWGAWSSTRKE